MLPAISLPASLPDEAPDHDLLREGYAFVPAAEMRALLGEAGEFSDWAAFAASWDRLEPDTYMADQGRYRKRRHAVFSADTRGAIRREAHQPHYQSRDYNALNGGIERWFAPIEPLIGKGPSLAAILRFCRNFFGRRMGMPKNWHIEAHQFRIEARADAPGKPTPEGMHRDGVDYALVLMVKRANIESGTTLIHAPDGKMLGQFTLTTPFDAALVDDARVMHSVTPVTALDPALPAYRDVLVVTFKAK
jgi:hypothetical protein